MQYATVQIIFNLDVHCLIHLRQIYLKEKPSWYTAVYNKKHSFRDVKVIDNTMTAVGCREFN